MSAGSEGKMSAVIGKIFYGFDILRENSVIPFSESTVNVAEKINVVKNQNIKHLSVTY